MGRRIALLVGNRVFLEASGLAELRGPGNDVDAIGNVLGAPELGNFEVRKLLDRPHHEVMRAVVETLGAAGTDDFVLIFYSGHGKTSVSGKLYLATADTDQQALQATAVSAWSLHEAVSESLCREVVLLLDCCYSGAVSTGLKGTLDSQLQAVQNAAGFFILTASTSIQTASENEADHDGKVMGRFTSAIVEGIRSGSADQRQTGEIRLTDLKAHVERTLRGQTPQFFAHAGSGDPLISHGARPLLDQAALADLDAEAWHRRAGVVLYLAGVVQRGRPRERQAARAKLMALRGAERDVGVRQAIDDALRAQEVFFSTTAHDKLLRGVNTLADVVKVTLGPRGRTVMIGKAGAAPRPATRGMSVADGVTLSDPVENFGIQAIHEAIARDADASTMDGTATAIVLARTLLAEGLKAVASGVDPIDLKNGLDHGVIRVMEAIRVSARKITANDEIARIAAVSADGDKGIGDLIATAADRIGSAAAIMVEETENAATTIDVVAGLRFDQGYVSPYFVTNAEKSLVEFDDPYVLILGKPLSALPPLVPLLEAVLPSNRPLLIVAPDVLGEALATLVVNKIRGGLTVAAVKAPGFGEGRAAMLAGIATLTGTQVVADDLGIRIDAMTIDGLGRARRIVVGRHETVIVCHDPAPGIDPVPADREDATLPVTGGLSCRIALVRVGGSSAAEVKEKRARLDAALGAVRAAAKGGFVPGGGVALLKAAAVLTQRDGGSDGESTAAAVLRGALEAPIRQIAENAGVDGGAVADKVRANASPDFGFDAQAKRYVDMIEAGIIDPVDVVCDALRKAVGIAGMLIATEAAVIEGVGKNGGEPGAA